MISRSLLPLAAVSLLFSNTATGQEFRIIATETTPKSLPKGWSDGNGPGPFSVIRSDCVFDTKAPGADDLQRASLMMDVLVLEGPNERDFDLEDATERYLNDRLEQLVIENKKYPAIGGIEEISCTTLFGDPSSRAKALRDQKKVMEERQLPLFKRNRKRLITVDLELPIAVK